MYHNHNPINILRCRYCIYLGIATMWSTQCHQLPLMVRIPIKVMSGVYGRFPTFHGPWGIYRYTEVAILWIYIYDMIFCLYIYGCPSSWGFPWMGVPPNFWFTMETSTWIIMDPEKPTQKSSWPPSDAGCGAAGCGCGSAGATRRGRHGAANAAWSDWHQGQWGISCIYI